MAKKYVLFIDDEPNMHELVKIKLRSYIRKGKMTLSCHLNGREALDFLSEKVEIADVIFVVSDINMPEMDGFEMLQNIKKLYPQIDVYMASAYGSQDSIDKAKSLGAKDYFVKPIDMNDIISLIDDVISEEV